MSTELTRLKPFADDAPPARRQRFETSWERFRSAATPDLLAILADIYFRVVDHYIFTCRAVPLHNISRPVNKRWAAALRDAGLPSTPLVSLLMPAADTKSLPLFIRLKPDGGYMLLPDAVIGTWYAVGSRNGGVILGERDGDVEPLGDLNDIKAGIADGPPLRGKGLALAQSPFDEPVPDLPTVTPLDDSVQPPETTG